MRNEQQACFHPFCSCGTSASCDLPIANGGGSMSWQHSLSPQRSIKGIKSSLLKLRGDPVATPASLFLHPSNSPSMLIRPSLTLSSVAVAADSAVSFSYSAGGVEVKLLLRFPGHECPDSLGRAQLLCCGSPDATEITCPGLCGAEDGSNALLPAVGWQHVSVGAGFISWLLKQVHRVEEGGFFCLLSHFFSTWNQQ